MMIVFLARNSLSYFQSYKNYFVAIYLTFLAFPAGGLVLMTTTLPTLQRISIQGIVTSGSVIAIVWGYVATKLYVYPETFSPRRLISRPFRPIFLCFGLYLLPMIIALVDGWTDPLAISTSLASTNYPLDSLALPTATVSSFLVGTGGAVVAAFTSYPLAVLSRRRALVKDREVRKALQIIAFTFGMISLALVLGFGFLALGYNILGPANFLSVALIIVAVQAFRKPTFLKTFLGVVPSLESSPSSAHYDQMILIHGPHEDKFGPIAKYVIEGLNQRERVIYFHNGDVSLLTDGLSREGVDVTRMTVKGMFRAPPLGSAYPKRGVFDETALDLIHEIAAEAKILGNEDIRVVMDYDDFSIRPIHKFVEHLMNPRWTSPDHHLHVLMVLESSSFHGEEASLAKLENRIRTIDMAETKDTFSQAIGVAREEVAGMKLLLQYDPQSDYERVLKSLLSETAANFERTVVLTRKDSALYSLAQRQPGTKIFLLTSRVSYPKMESDNLFLLPSYDTSLVLDAINKTIEAYSGTSYTIIFDNLSHFIFTIGPERTYSLVRQSLELMVSNRITAVFALNSKAHDLKTVSTFENMFDTEISCELGKATPEVRKKISITR
ncbi:hypothetical protein J2P12_02725 [Candidatus Bathyarchaeota archaeon]|nr:hypothetical protein [Candidatus Bathyarchaeota archaeon]